jgi:hypothetical protein
MLIGLAQRTAGILAQILNADEAGQEDGTKQSNYFSRGQPNFQKMIWKRSTGVKTQDRLIEYGNFAGFYLR